GDETAHAADLTHLARVPTGAGRGHHVDGPALVERIHHGAHDRFGRLGPVLHRLLVTLFLGDEAARELTVDLADLLLGRRDRGRLDLRNGHVVDRDRDAGVRRRGEADALDLVHDVRRDVVAVLLEDSDDDVADRDAAEVL